MILFYNGPGTMPEHLYLSNAYEDRDDPDVQVRVRVINIRSGQSRILELCRPLQDYTTFVETFQRYHELNGVSDRVAASMAIASLRSGEVRDYLMTHEAEVVDMLLTEYDEEKTLQAEYYAGERAGLQQGSLNMLYDLAADGTLSMADAVRKAMKYGVTDEADFRRRAAEQGIQLSE